MTLRFLLDEHVWHGLIVVGRELGFDIVPAQHVLPIITADDFLLAFAAAEERILLTSNARDFAPLAIEWFLSGKIHAGIVIIPGQTDRSMLSKALRNISNTQTAESFRNTFRYIQEFI